MLTARRLMGALAAMLAACTTVGAPMDAGTDAVAVDAHVVDASSLVDAWVPPGCPTTGWPTGWRPTFCQEFDVPNGSSPDPAIWTPDVTGNGWGNQELQYYTSASANIFIENGDLVLRAMRDASGAHTCWYGPCQYTSAQLESIHHFSQAYGRFEARMKIPAGVGLWPAFWMLGANSDTVHWPACGEIDVMESVGMNPGTVYGTLHMDATNSATTNVQDGQHYVLPGGAALSDAYHVYAVEWAPGVVRFYLDDTLYFTAQPTDAMITSQSGHWVFDHPFYLLLDLAVGGNWPGSPTAATVFPADLHVDYVRVYEAM
jgi:beta-glucanase (GH16 family)